MDNSAQPATIIGGPISPYVRKVLAVCELKGVPYRLDPIVPFFGDDKFSELSPLRRIPVFVDDQVSLCDSTVICEYLEERYPNPAVLPSGASERARARWIEEFADTRFGGVAVWKIFYHAVVLPFVFGKERETDKIARAVAEDLPQVMDYLEGLAPAERFLFGEPSIADISVAAFSCNLRWARSAPDAARWPKSCAWFERTLALPAVAKVTRYGDSLMRTPPAEQRQALADLGVALTETTLATRKPRRGPMATA
jgi:glutathione S-transferase